MSIFKRTVKNAFRTVLFNWREYAGFFLALVVVQCIFWSLTLSLDTGNRVAEQTVKDSYSYHVVIPDMDGDQVALFKNLLNAQGEIDDSFYEVEILKTGEKSEAHVTLKGINLQRSFAKFQDRCMKARWTYSLTPLYTYQTDYVLPGVLRYALLCFVMLALSAAILTLLYIIRIENHQFQYGIYMTCGGDFRTLFRVAFWDLAAIAVLTFVPSGLLSALIMLAVYLPGGVLFCLTPWAPVLVLLLTALTVLLAVFLPVRIMCAKTPMALITSRDNAGHVSSPRRSFRLFGKRFPRDYELAGMWRMRKYYVRLVCSAVAFASLFITGLYIADMISTGQSAMVDEFLLAYGNMPDEPLYDEEGNKIEIVYTPDQADAINDDAAYMTEMIGSMPGVAYVDANERIGADWLLAHMLIKSRNAKEAGEYAVASTGEREGYDTATNSYKYTAVDRAWIDHAIASGQYCFEGDPYEVLENPHAIIVSEAILGMLRFDFSVGDRVYFASYVEGTIESGAITTKRDQILLQQLEHFKFHYGSTGSFTGEYEVCAVITKSPADSYLTVGMQTDTYRTLTGKDGARDVVTVYLEDGTSLARADEIAADVATLAGDFGWNLRRNNLYFDHVIQNARADHLIAVVIAILILSVSPMVWFFSQTLFYRRREGEFYMLSAMGGFPQEIRGLHLTAGVILSGLAFVVTFVMSYAFNMGLYLLMSSFLPSLGIVKAANYHYYMPLWALVLCAVVSVLCAFASSFVPYLMWKRRRKLQENAQKKEG